MCVSKFLFKGIRLSFLATDCRGQGLVEYALLLFLITLVVFAMIVIFGQHLGNTYELINCSVPDVGK